MTTAVTVSQETELLQLCSDAQKRLAVDGSTTIIYLDNRGNLNAAINPAEDYMGVARPWSEVCFFNETFPLGHSENTEDPRDRVAALEAAGEERCRFYSERQKVYGAGLSQEDSKDNQEDSKDKRRNDYGREHFALVSQKRVSDKA